MEGLLSTGPTPSSFEILQLTNEEKNTIYLICEVLNAMMKPYIGGKSAVL